jgi:hypothetical protein
MLGSKDPAIFLLIFMAGVAILWLNRMIMAFCRSRTCPHCWYCGAAKVTKCHSYRKIDYLPFLSMMVPLGCQGCLKRFYGIRGVMPVKHRKPAVTLPATPKPAVAQVRVRLELKVPAYSKPTQDRTPVALTS